MKTHSARKNLSQSAQGHSTHELNRSAPKGSKYESGLPPFRTRLHGRFMLGSLVVLGSIILFNALALQKERHPSPLFQPLAAPKPIHYPAAISPMQQAARQDGKQDIKHEQVALTNNGKKQSLETTAPAITIPSTPAPLQAYQQPPSNDKDALKERLANVEKQKTSVVAVIEADAVLLTDLQRELRKRGHYKGEIDGKSGPMMTQAIRSFQFSQRVAVDGKPSEALLREVRKTKIPPKRDEILDLIEKTTPSLPSTISQRTPYKAG